MPSSFKRQVAGQPLAQVDNPDPFAVPVWRSPVYQTPHFIIWPVQLVRLVWRLAWFVLRHPLLAAVCAALAFTWLKLSWAGLVVLAVFTVTTLGLVYLLWPAWFAAHVTGAARDWRLTCQRSTCMTCATATRPRAKWTELHLMQHSPRSVITLP